MDGHADTGKFAGPTVSAAPKTREFLLVWLPSDRKLLHRQGRRSFNCGDAVLHLLLHLLERVHVDLAHALARDAELVGEFRERDRVLGEPARFEDAPLAIVERGERRGERLAAVVELVARGKRGLLAGTLVNQPVASRPMTATHCRQPPSFETKLSASNSIVNLVS